MTLTDSPNPVPIETTSLDLKRSEIEAARLEGIISRRDYDSVWHATYASYENRMIMSLLPGTQDITVLDCGCGVGVLLRDLVRQYTEVHGLDISFDSLQLVGISDSSLKGLVVGDAERLPYCDSVFDAIILRGALHHVPDVDRALQEFRRTLKHGGTLILHEPCGDSRLIRWGRRKLSRRQERYFRIREIEEYLVRNGFVCTVKRRTAYLAFALSYLFRERLSRLARPAWFYQVCVNLLILVDNMLSQIPGVRTTNLGVLVLGRVEK